MNNDQAITQFMKNGHFQMHYQAELPSDLVVNLSITFQIVYPKLFQTALNRDARDQNFKTPQDIQNWLQSCYIDVDDFMPFDDHFEFTENNGIKPIQVQHIKIEN